MSGKYGRFIFPLRHWATFYHTLVKVWFDILTNVTRVIPAYFSKQKCTHTCTLSLTHTHTIHTHMRAHIHPGTDVALMSQLTVNLLRWVHFFIIKKYIHLSNLNDTWFDVCEIKVFTLKVFSTFKQPVVARSYGGTHSATYMVIGWTVRYALPYVWVCSEVDFDI